MIVVPLGFGYGSNVFGYLLLHIIAGALGFQPLAMAATLVVRYMGPGALTVAVVVSEQQL